MTRLFLAGIILLFSINASAKSIVVLGDSLSAAYGMKNRQGWVALLQDKLNAEQLGYKVFNESISGDTSAGGLARIGDALSQHQPDILILELGANDGLRGLSPKIMKSNLAKIIQRAHNSGAKVLLLSMRIPPNFGKRYTEMFYNVYPQLAEEMSVVFVPFILQDIALVKDMMQTDALHPAANAQPLILDAVWMYLEGML